MLRARSAARLSAVRRYRVRWGAWSRRRIRRCRSKHAADRQPGDIDVLLPLPLAARWFPRTIPDRFMLELGHAKIGKLALPIDQRLTSPAGHVKGNGEISAIPTPRRLVCAS